MKAVVMAGGEGTRFRPLTSLRPKPMVPIVNQPVMEHILGLVKHHGMDEAVATLAFMPQGHRGLLREWRGVGNESLVRPRGDSAGDCGLGQERAVAHRR